MQKKLGAVIHQEDRNPFDMIIYCRTLHKLIVLTAKIKEITEETVQLFHANLHPDYQKEILLAWFEGKIKILVSSVACGMVSLEIFTLLLNIIIGNQ